MADELMFNKYTDKIVEFDISDIQENTIIRLGIAGETGIYYPSSKENLVGEPDEVKYITGNNVIYTDSDYLVKLNINFICNVSNLNYEGNKTVWDSQSPIPRSFLEKYFNIVPYPEYLESKPYNDKNSDTGCEILVPLSESNPITDLFPKITGQKYKYDNGYDITIDTPDYTVGIPNTNTGLGAVPIIAGSVTYKYVLSPDGSRYVSLPACFRFIAPSSTSSRYNVLEIQDTSSSINYTNYSCYYYPPFYEPTYLIWKVRRNVADSYSYIIRIIPEVIPKTSIGG